MYIKELETDILFASLDSYTESGRNFYVYFNESTKKMEWIIWDTNMSFGGYMAGQKITPESLSLLYTNSTSARPLTSKIFNNNTLKTDYLKTIADVFNNNFVPAKLFPHADSIASVIRPYVVSDMRKQYTLAQFDSNLVYDVTLTGGGPGNPGGGPGGGGPGGSERRPGIKSFITARQANVKTQLVSLGITGVKETSSAGNIPSDYSLYQNFPNPFNPTTNIKYQIPVTGEVTLKVFNVLGKNVATLVNETQQAGTYTVMFNSTGLSSGIYFYQLKSGKFLETRKFIVLK